MMKALVLGTILGGLVAFVWSSVSWEVIGWHEKTMVKFQNEDEVSAVIASHAPVDGTYLLPAGPSTDGMTPDQKKATQAATMEKMQKGPIMFATVRRGGFGSFSRGLIIQLLSLMAAAFLLTWLLLQTSGLSYARSVAFLAIVGLSASVIVDLPNWNWWGFSGAYTAVNLADSTITWLLAGLVIAKVAKPKTS
jgi:lipoprotein signal peptidase